MQTFNNNKSASKESLPYRGANNISFYKYGLRRRFSSTV